MRHFGLAFLRRLLFTFILYAGNYDFIKSQFNLLRNPFEQTGLFPVYWHFTDLFKNTYDFISMKYSSENCNTREIFTSLDSIRKPRLDKAISEDISALEADIKDPSRMLQKVPVVVEEEKTVNKIFIGLQPMKLANSRAQKRTSLPLGTPAEHLTVGVTIK